jgi:hypothetical protein
MIDMGMGQEHRGDRGEIDRSTVPVALTPSAITLKESAIDQDSRLPVRNEIFRTGYCAGAAEKLECDAQSELLKNSLLLKQRTPSNEYQMRLTR